MTTTKPSEGPLTPRELTGDAREELRIALERLHLEHHNGIVDDSTVLSRLRDWRSDMPDTDMWALWEQISEACNQLREIRDDFPTPSITQYGADLVVEHGINELARECCE